MYSEIVFNDSYKQSIFYNKFAVIKIKDIVLINWFNNLPVYQFNLNHQIIFPT